MSNSIYFSGQYVSPDDLNNTETQRIADIKLRTQLGLASSGGFQSGSGSIYRGGIVGSVLDYLDASKNLRPTKISDYELTVGAGLAIDVNGEVISVPTLQTLIFGETTDFYTWATGSIGQTNYIKVAYQEASASIVYDPIRNVTQPHRYTSSYYITVNNAPPASADVLLGTFTTSVNGNIEGSVVDKRLYAMSVIPSESVYIDPVNNPLPSVQTFYAHEQAVGTGTPSVTNPHGISYTDIGAAAAGVVLTLADLNNNAYTIGTVYQNSSASVWLSCEGTVFEYYEGEATPEYSIDIALQISASGSAGAGGTLTAPVYTLARAYQQVVTAVTNKDYVTRKIAVRGFIPSGYFFRFDSINTPGWYDPTHDFSLQQI